MREVNLAQTAVFLQLNLSRMGDKRGVSSDDITVDADKDKVKVRKVIFKTASFDAIKSLDSEVRRYVRAQCFPFESGLHLVPLPMVEQITQQLKIYRTKRNSMINRFAEVFPTIVREAQPKLRALYNEADYNLDNIASQFDMSWQFMMLTAPSGLESVNADLLKSEGNKMHRRFQEALDEARLLLRETCLNLVSHLRISLESDSHGMSKRLSTSTVRHLQEFLGNFELRNITNDEELQILVRQARSLTDGVDAESLRTMDGLRMRMRGELSIIEESITKTLQVAPTRRIRA